MTNAQRPRLEAVETEERGPIPVLDHTEVAAIASRNFEIATRTARACASGAMRLNKSIFGFYSARIKKDIQAAQEIMTARTSEQAFHKQAVFVETALRDYADQASIMMHMAADIAQQALGPAEERAEELLHDLDERAGEAAGRRKTS